MVSMHKTLFVSFLSVFVAVGFACGSKNGDSGFNDGTGSDGGQIGEGGKGFGGGTGEGGTGGCTGLQCKEVDCPGGGDTTITGQVFDPIGLNPLYGVAVYVPSQLPLSALSTGATCDRCGATVLNPASTTLTDEHGKFTLTHVPVDAKVPVVVQIGKWRRTFNLDVTACQENPMPTPLTLPKNGTEGDIPQVAVAYGGADALECLLYGMGLDKNEFVQGATAPGTGHVHIYGEGKQQTLWASKDTLQPYDITMLDCEGDEVTTNKSDAIIQGMHDYAGEGGKIFASHYESIFFKGNSPGHGSLKAPADFVATANWNSNYADSASSGTTGTINTGFPKGASFAQWMQNVGASKTLGTITDMGYANSVKSVAGDTTLWISDHDNSNNTLYMSFNTPTTVSVDNQCGKVVYTDLHVSGGAVASVSDCSFKSGSDRTKGMTDQQKALEFLFFDLSSCVSNDANPPQPPR